MVSRYVTNGPVKQEGICLLPAQPHHYRMIAPQRQDGFHVATQQTFVPQPPQNQANNQVQPLRGMPPTGPPTQASTPPNSDLKVQQMPQQPSMNLTYVSQAPVRAPTQNFYSRAPPPSTQTPRMPNHRQGQQPLYPTQPTQYVPMTLQTMYLNTSTPVQYFNGGPRPQASYVAPGYPMMPSQHITYPYPQAPSQPQPTFYYNPSQLMQRAPPQVAAAPQNPAQPPVQPMSLAQPVPQHTSHSKNKRRSRAIPIIDPSTGKDKLSEMYEQEQDDSHPPSGESSARQTPQPPLPNPNKEVQAAFAKQVAQAIGKDEAAAGEELDPPPPVLEQHMVHPMYPPQPQPVVHQRYDTIVQSSKLQAATKEFIPAALSTAKETTPVVSAITDAVEVTITNKPKDRESPAKGRKQREQVASREREHKDTAAMAVPVKEPSPPAKDTSSICEKPVVVSCSSSKEESKQKEAVVLGVVGPGKEMAPAAFVPPRDDKKVQKKDKADAKPSPPSSIAASDDSPPESGLVIPVSPSIPENALCSAKPKHNASQKTKEAPKQAPQQQQPTPPPPPPQQQQQPALVPPKQPPVQPQPPLPPVPVTQPSKPTNKTNKMRELNMKGASKEGTDMDAFNDSLAISEDDTNANHSTTTAATTDTSSDNTTDYLHNANNVMLNNNVNISSSPIVNDSNKRAESNDVSTIKPPPPVAEIKAPPKVKIDVTDIVKEVPKPMKPIVVPAPLPVESPDEPDHASLANDKMVQAKNEANAKVSAEAIDANATDGKVNLPYRDDQWSPSNKDGKKVYDRDFLLALRKDPKSNKKPDNLPPDIIPNDERGRIGDISRYAMGGRGATDFAPNFSSNSYPSKSSSQRGVPPKRKSQQGSIGGGSKGGKQGNVIRVSISVKEDVKLHETENAWRPARLLPGAPATEDDKKTAELYKKVRGVLNKLTPQKFETLVHQVRSLAIDTTERLQGVIDLVFEKAVDEPNFSVAYALLCRELALMQVNVPSDSKKREASEFVNFRKLLVTRCQLEFEKNSADESERAVKVKEMDACADPEKKKDMLLELDEYDRRLRMKSVGNIRFIGELFKQQMLTVNIMLRCLNNLLDTKDEESLECLCKLLTTVGKELETKKVDLGPIFGAMRDIADKKQGRISSRVRFMIQDVIDLRSSRWVPRRQDLNPKTMDQIQKEAESEHMTIQAMNSVPITPRRDDRGGGGGGGGGGNVNASADKKRRNVSSEDGWSTASSRSNRTPFTVQCDKLKNKPPMMDEPLGSSHMFGNWGRGSNIKTQPPQALTNTANMYAALENIGTESDKKPLGGLRPNSKDPYHSKGPSLERTYRQYEDGRGSRSGSQHRSRDSSTASQRNTTPAPVPSVPKVQPPAGIPPAPVPVELTADQLERRLKNILEEYLNDCCTVQECEQDIKASISPSALPQLVSDGYISVLERSKTARLRTGYLFGQLIKLGTLSVQDYCAGLENVLEEADELIIDIPKVWDYVAELISPVLCDSAISLQILHQSLKPLIANDHASKLLICIFKLIIQEKGPNFLQSSWNSSGLTLADFMPESQVDDYVKENKFEFLLEAGDSSPVSQSHSPSLGMSYEEIHDKLLAFFKSATSFDDIINWISANVGENAKENQFIRTLATACFKDSIVNMKLKIEILQGKYSLLHRFVDNKPAYELQCLFALQALINQLEHPQGLLLAICDKLYEENVFSHESFVAWETSRDPAEQEGKGVALKQLTSFFTQLKEADEDSSSASEDA